MGGLSGFFKNFGNKSEKELRKEQRRAERKIDKKRKKLKKRIDELKEEAEKKWEKAQKLKMAGNNPMARSALKDYRNKEQTRKRLEPKLSVLDMMKNMIIVSGTEKVLSKVVENANEVLDLDPESLEDMVFELEDMMDEHEEASEIMSEFQEHNIDQMDNEKMPSIEDLSETLEEEVNKKEKIEREKSKLEEIKDIIDDKDES